MEGSALWRGCGGQLALDEVIAHVHPRDPAARVAEIVRRSGTSFYWAMRLLPAPKRNAMFAVYAFCREVDDVADGPEPPDVKMRALAGWEGEIDRLYAGS